HCFTSSTPSVQLRSVFSEHAEGAGAQCPVASHTRSTLPVHEYSPGTQSSHSRLAASQSAALPHVSTVTQSSPSSLHCWSRFAGIPVMLEPQRNVPGVQTAAQWSSPSDTSTHAMLHVSVPPLPHSPLVPQVSSTLPLHCFVP